MALRILLADESSTIKKAIQMALSELGVDVKSVPSGLDVLSVSRSFKPDLILADVLLTKKNGYEVCGEIKADPELRKTPVILMWSSFMQLDQEQFNRAQAEASLEKPFDSETLRGLVEKFAPKINHFPLKGLLNHPELPDFEESDTFVKQKTEFFNSKKPVEPPLPVKTHEAHESDDLDDFTEVSLQPKQKNSDPTSDDWAETSAGQFIIETESHGDFEEVTVLTSQQQKVQEQLNHYIQDAPLAKSRAQSHSSTRMTSLDEQIMKEEIRLIAEKICWQILPEITEKIVREELRKLLGGLEKI